jgi:hypothetical protein
MTVDPDGEATHCPFALRADEALNITWSIGTYPDITVESIDDLVVVGFSSEADGLVRYDAPRGWQDDEFPFDFEGTATADGETIKVYAYYS